METNSPVEISVTSAILQPPLQTFASRVGELIQQVMSRIPPELTTDVIDKGILLSGGLARLDGLDNYLVKRLGVPAAAVEDPDRVVIKGMVTILQHLDEFTASLGYYQQS